MRKLVKFDYAIKYLLRNKANFVILEGFLSELLKTDIKIQSILESESNKKFESDKFNRVDLLAETSDKQQIIIEVQCERQADYLSRILYGTSKVITETIKESDAYISIKKVISVSIVYFDLGKGKDYIYKGTTQFKGIHYNDKLKLGPKEKSQYLGMIKPEQIYPEYYILKVNQFNKKVKDKLDEWLYFFKTNKIEPDFNAKGIQKASKEFDLLNLSDQERADYNSYQENLHYESSMILSHYGEGRREGLREGKADGIAQGIGVGFEEGIAKGREEGIAKGEKAKAISIANKLKEKGLSPKEISDIIGIN